MNQNKTREELLAVAKASPAAVAVHDKKAWVSLFATYNVVEDPVGSTPHLSGVLDQKTGKRGTGPLERFYDNFIAPNTINFKVNRDIVAGNKVLRDLTIELTMSTGLPAFVPMHLLYETVEENGAIKICRLGAYWELPAMIKQVLSKGFSGIYAMTAMGIRMMKHLGITGALGFSKGFIGIHTKGKMDVNRFIDAVHSKNSQKLMGLFSPNDAVIEFPAGTASFSPDTFLSNVDATITASKIMSAGFNTTFTVEVACNGKKHQGIGIFEFNSKTKKIEKARFFWEE